MHMEDPQMSRGLKSSLDIALDRMKKIVGEDDLSLSEDQKNSIAKLRTEYEAKIADVVGGGLCPTPTGSE